jgi:D-glycero-D-manno-heptose 1,7-bisphosphate phosphatase
MRIVILDRDGVINFDRPHFIRGPDEFEPIPGSLDAVARLTQAGYRVVVATNQSGIGRGLLDMGALNAIHAKLHRLLAAGGGRIDAYFYCPHPADSGCICRKPLPGLLEEIALRYHIDLAGVPAIGDSLRDLEAAHAVGARPMLVKTGKGAITLAAGGLPGQTEVFADLIEAVGALLN